MCTRPWKATRVPRRHTRQKQLHPGRLPRCKWSSKGGGHAVRRSGAPDGSADTQERLSRHGRSFVVAGGRDQTGAGVAYGSRWRMVPMASVVWASRWADDSADTQEQHRSTHTRHHPASVNTHVPTSISDTHMCHQHTRASTHTCHQPASVNTHVRQPASATHTRVNTHVRQPASATHTRVNQHRSTHTTKPCGHVSPKSPHAYGCDQGAGVAYGSRWRMVPNGCTYDSYKRAVWASRGPDGSADTQEQHQSTHMCHQPASVNTHARHPASATHTRVTQHQRHTRASTSIGQHTHAPTINHVDMCHQRVTEEPARIRMRPGRRRGVWFQVAYGSRWMHL